jgi:membrane protein
MTAGTAAPSFWRFSELKRLFSQAYTDFSDDEAPRLGAALAYYTALSLAPLLILMIAIAGLVFGKDAAQGQLFSQIEGMVGAEGGKMIENMVLNAAKPSSGIIASIIAFATLLFGASSVANELRLSLNAIWELPSTEGIKSMVKERSLALLTVLGCGFLLLVSLTVSSIVAGAGEALARWLPFSEPVLYLLNLALSLSVLSVVFAFLFKFLPDAKVKWSEVLPGAAVTALLFMIGNFLIGMYLGNASFGSTYGAAGSLVIVLVWVYYSAQIVFFGAEVTQVYACERGSETICSATKQDPQSEKSVTGTLKTSKAKSYEADYPRTAAAGGSGINAGMEPAGKTTGWFGLILGSILAGGKASKGLRK